MTYEWKTITVTLNMFSYGTTYFIFSCLLCWHMEKVGVMASSFSQTISL